MLVRLIAHGELEKLVVREVAQLAMYRVRSKQIIRKTFDLRGSEIFVCGIVDQTHSRLNG